MGVEDSNQQQYGVNEAMAELVAINPNTTQAQRNKWRSLGTQAILDEVARLTSEKASRAKVKPVVVEEPAVEPVDDKAKSKKNG